MPNILLIETSTEVCSVGICSGEALVSLREIRDQKSHASKVAAFIEEVLQETDIRASSLEAVAVSSGPGSYTGLRIGVSTAKGLCYALGIPLIATNSLNALAMGFAAEYQHMLGTDDILVPMTDARRMEVYAAIFDKDTNLLSDTEAIILDETSFSKITAGKIWLFGDGAAKTSRIFSHRKEINIIQNFLPSAKHLLNPALSAFVNKDFVDPAYFEPFYLKDFVAGIPKVKGLK